MTNEEKIKEIAEKEIHPIIAERCAREMAEWKDQQFKEYLEKKKEESAKWVEQQSWYGNDAYDILENKERIEFVNQIINELFG